MAKLNSSLLNSLLIDIKEYTNVANEAATWIEDGKHLSWKYPQKLAKKVSPMEIIKKRKGTAGEMYILLLEMAYDRIHFVLELIVDFLKSETHVRGFATSPKRLVKLSKAKFTSPATAINKLLCHLKALSFTKSTDEKTNLRIARGISRSTQAESCFQFCENCSVVCQSLLDLISRTENTFRDNKFISHVVQAREDIKMNLLERTQWQVVTKLSAALSNDIDEILTSTTAIRNENEALRKERDKVALSLSRAERNVGIKNFQLNEMRMKFDEMKENNEALSTVIEEMRKKVIYLTELNATVEHQLAMTSASKLGLENSLADARETIKRLQPEIGNFNVSMKFQNQEMVKQLRKMRIDGDLKTRDSLMDQGLIDSNREEKIPVPSDDPR